MARTKYRTVWISDTHLGSRGSQAGILARFLKRIDCHTLYLVGDTVDFWRMRNKPYWPRDHDDVVRRILKLVKRGTRVIVVPGNHDDGLRQYDGVEIGRIAIRRSDVHECLDGRKLLVTHGDQYDMIVTHSRLATTLGSVAYEWLLTLNRVYNRYRRWRKLPYWSLAQYIKLKVKSACTYVSKFEGSLLGEARRRELDGVVCGHIHKPAITDSTPQYINCGDWIENCSAIVEHLTGELELVYASEFLDPHVDDDPDEDLFDWSQEPEVLEIGETIGQRLIPVSS